MEAQAAEKVIVSVEYILKNGIATKEEAEEVGILLKRACKAYYEEDVKLMSDDDFDLLNEIYERFTGEIVSGSKGTASMEHGYQRMMNTLKKAKSLEEFEEWLIPVVKDIFGSSLDLDRDIIEMGLSDKMDGNSVLVEYALGKATRAVTRGKDGMGVDVTSMFSERTIQLNLTCGVKYEAMVRNSKMPEVSKLRGKELVDARSAITGILGRDNGQKYAQFIDLFPIDVSLEHRNLKREEVLELLDELHGDSSPNCSFVKISGTVRQVIAKIKEIYDRNIEGRLGRDHGVDGLVIEFLDEAIRERLGWHQGTSTYPKYARALKYPAYEKTTVALRMEFDIGTTGRITPCVVFKPVVINGRTYQRTSIANYRRFMQMKVGEGMKLLFSLAGDVIGYLDVLNVPENVGIEPWKFAETCPECGAGLHVNENGTYVYCKNPECDALVVGKLLKWVKKNGFKGIAESTLSKLIAEGFLSNVPSIYQFVHNQAMKDRASEIDGLGETSISNFANIILSQTKIKDYIVLAVTSPEGIGRTGCKPICKNIPLSKMFELAQAGRMDELVPMLIEQEGVQDVNAQKIVKGLTSDLMKWAFANGFISIEETYSEAKEAAKTGMNICVTGKLNSGSRDQLVARLEAAGHTFHKSVGKNTNILLTNDATSGSDKNEKAKKFGVEVLSEDEVIAKLGL